jgi:hypothetical protein
MLLDQIEASGVAQDCLERCNRTASHARSTPRDTPASRPPLGRGGLARDDVRLHALDVYDPDAAHEPLAKQWLDVC